MKRTRTALGFVAALLMLCMLLTACAQTTTPEPPASENPAPAQEQPAPADQSAPAAPAESPEVLETSSRDTINLAVNQVFETLNAYQTGSLIDYQLHFQIYEGMFFVNDAGEFEPRVCKDFVIGEDGLTYTVTLNDGVKFHNGKDVTAEDVAWSLSFMAKDGSYLTRRNTVALFESAEVVDEKTVVIKTTEASATFFGAMCMNCAIYSKDEFLAAETAGTLGVEWVPMGTGPYVVTSYNPDTMVKLEAFPEYYRGEARIKYINYQVLLDNNSTTIAFESGDLDFITVPTASWTSLSSNENYNTYLSPTTHVSVFMVNTHNEASPLSNKLVRQALAYGMDREAMCIVAYDGIAEPASSYFNPRTLFGGFTAEELEEAGVPTYQYDPEKAKALLAEAGYPDGCDIGTILCINGSYWEKLATVFQDNMREIGVTVGVELADSAACRARRAELDYDLATTGYTVTLEPSDLYRVLRSVTPEMIAGGDRTDLNVNNEKLEQLFQTAKVTMDPEARRAVYLEFAREMNDQLYMFYTFHKSIPYAYAKDLVCDKINTNYYFVYNFTWK